MVAPPTVTAEVIVGDGHATGRQHCTSLRLSWYAADPLAVHLLLTAQPDHPALPRGRWTMLRDFLSYGLTHATGDGDVRVRPDAAGALVVLELFRDGRCTTVRVPASTVQDFLDATEAVVPAGEERSEAALDELIARLSRA
ncbi:MAG TPA: SsgA family sporulation/cell division regulator [Mycobacteriales bacterium]|nr:SsgA family sporulation/cell division regulator [Mycobacteriales bacterium]